MTNDMPLPFELPAVRSKKLTVDFAGGNQSSDAGMLLRFGIGVIRLASAIGSARSSKGACSASAVATKTASITMLCAMIR